MRAILTIALLLSLAPAAHADLGDVETALGEVAFDEARVSPDGGRLAFITRRNDELWLLDLAGPEHDPPAQPVRLAGTEHYASLRWSPDGHLLSFLSAADREGSQLYVLEPVPKASPRRLTDPARFADGVDVYDWLPDGSGLIFVAGEPPEESSAARKTFYGDVRRLAGPPAKPYCYRIALAGGDAARVAGLPFEVASEVAPAAGGVAVGFCPHAASPCRTGTKQIPLPPDLP